MAAFVKSLIGGVVIMLVATAAGVSYNAVRANGVKLITPVPVSNEAAVSGTTDGSADTGKPDGEMTVEKMKEIFDEQSAYIIDARGPVAFEGENQLILTGDDTELIFERVD